MFQLEIDDVDAKLEVVSLRGVERISEPFDFELEVLTGGSSLATHIGQGAALTIGGTGTTRHGLLQRVTMLGVEGAEVRYRLGIVPDLVRLNLRANCRVFQNVTVDDVLSMLLEEHEVTDVELSLSEVHAPRPYLVQYRETDLEFAQRLLEEEGMFYFFQHKKDRSKLVIADDAASYLPIPGRSASLRYGPHSGAQERVSRFSLSSRAGTDAVRMRSYNYETPSASLDLSKKVARSAGSAELFDYPGGYQSRAAGQSRVRWRLDAERVPVSSADAATNVPRIAPGHIFALTDHGHRPANSRYVATGVLHQGEQAEPGSRKTRYHNEVDCVSAGLPYRSTGRYPRLTMKGPQTATVVGPVGEEVHVDEHGRVKVQFHWDRDGQQDENSSAWIRVAQVSAGKGWGAVTIPRIGHEVLVDFVDGDANQPVIVGSLYNGSNRPPYPLPEKKNKAGVTTRSTPGGSGYNELSFDDTAGEEKVLLRSQKDLEVQAGNDAVVAIGADLSIANGNNFTHTIDNDHALGTAGTFTHVVGKDHVLESEKGFTHTVGAAYSCTATGSATLLAKTLTLGATDKITLQVGSARLVMRKNGDITIDGKAIKVEATGLLTLKGSNTT